MGRRGEEEEREEEEEEEEEKMRQKDSEGRRGGVNTDKKLFYTLTLPKMIKI